MGVEIERKFLVKTDSWRFPEKKMKLVQGYLNSGKERTVRVRTMEDRGFLTIKGITTGAVRSEWEYEIPYGDAREMLEKLCEVPLIEKVRCKIRYHGLIWEVDEFLGENLGLVVAEVELESENQPFDRPRWVGREVTGDARYFNSSLVRHPFCLWPENSGAGNR